MSAETITPPNGYAAAARQPHGTPQEDAPDTEVLREQARQAYRTSRREAKRPLTGRELGELMHRSERWGRERIAEARNETDTETETEAALEPGQEVSGRGRTGSVCQRLVERQRRRFGFLTPDWLVKWSTVLAVLGVAAVAAVVSYRHAYALVRQYGEQGLTAALVPFTVDGLIYASSMVMLHSSRRCIPVPALARWLLALGIAATLVANATHGFGHGVPGALVAMWPAVALVGAYELLMLIIRNTATSSAAAGEQPGSHQPGSHQPDLAVSGVRSAVPEGEVPNPEPTATVEREPALQPEPMLKRAREVFAQELANGRVPSIRAIRARLRVGQPKAQDLQAYLAVLADGQQQNGGTTGRRERSNDPT